MLKINCPKCRREIEISADKLGETVTCDFCKNSFVAGSSPLRGDSAGNGEMEGRSAEPLSDGKFREIDYKGTFYSLQVLWQLKKHFSRFAFLLLFLIACFTAIENRAEDINMSIPLTFVFFLLLFMLTFILLFVSYSELLSALQEHGYRRTVCLVLYWFPLFMFILMVCLRIDFASYVYLLFVVAPLIADFVLLLFFMIKAVLILKSARVLPDKGNLFVRTLKRYSFVLFPLFIFLLVSFVLFGSVRPENNLCKNCGIWIEKENICVSGISLFSLPKYKPTAFSRFLDPEHQCSHHSGTVVLPTGSRRSIGILGFHSIQTERKYCLSIIYSPEFEIKSFLAEYRNIEENSPSIGICVKRTLNRLPAG